MKKLFSVLMALCLFCAAVSALADAVPSFVDMPAVVVEDDTTTVELSAFNGTWVVDKIFVNTVYTEPENLRDAIGINVPMTIRIDNGSFYYDEDNGEGGTDNKGYACTFEAGQLQGEPEGVSICFDTLVDGNILMTVFVPGENEQMNEASFFLVPAEA